MVIADDEGTHQTQFAGCCSTTELAVAPSNNADDAYSVLTLSARSHEALADYAAKFAEFLARLILIPLWT